MKKGKKNILRIYLKNSRKVKLSIIIIVILFGSARYSFAIERLKGGMDLYMKGRYQSAQKKIISYLKKNPEDSLAIDILEMISKAICSIHLKKAFSLFSEELDNMANKELEKAAKCHPEYTKLIEEKFSSYLKEDPKTQAANKVMLELLNNPELSENAVYEINRRLRKIMTGSLSKADRARLKKLKITVTKLKGRKKWDEALELVIKFMINNPDCIEIKLMLSEINRLASEDFYNQAVGYFEKAKSEQVKISARKSRNYDPEWFESKISSATAEAKINIAMKKDAEAKSQFNLLRQIDPENPGHSVYLGLCDIEKEDIFENSIKMYNRKNFIAAIAGFEFLKLKEPGNKRARLYFHLAHARKFIKKMKLKKVKSHLIKALAISPDEKEAVDIFERLQDILAIMSRT